ncbi:hypothetical protein H1Q59_05785 [Holosporaceae bacterium 'Namur']|nr:hypothetical protein [Holosporaceae bacterium 'Namur']
MQHKQNLTNEIFRKLIHLSSIWVPLSLLFVPISFMQAVFFTLALSLTLFDTLRISKKPIGQKIRKFLNKIKLNFIYREHEINNLSGATYMMTSAAFCSFIFDTEIFIISFSVLIISDTLAAIVGKSIGKRSIYNKTLEGSLTFFISSLIISEILYIFLLQRIGYSLTILIIASAFTTLVELYSKKFKMDDNLSIPISFGLILLIYKYFMHYN